MDFKRHSASLGHGEPLKEAWPSHKGFLNEIASGFALAMTSFLFFSVSPIFALAPSKATPSQKVCQKLENALGQHFLGTPSAQEICQYTSQERADILAGLSKLAESQKSCEDLDKIQEGGDESETKDLKEKCSHTPTRVQDLLALITNAQNELANRDKKAAKQRPKLQEIKKITQELKKITKLGSPGSYAKVAPRVTQYLEGAKKPASDSPNLGTDTSAKPPVPVPGESEAGSGTAPGPAAEKTGDRPAASPPSQSPGTAPGESAPADLVKLKGQANGNQSPINQSIKVVNKVGGKGQLFGRIFLDSGIDISASEKISQRVALTAETCQGEGEKKTCNYYPLGTVSIGAIETNGDLRHQIKRSIEGKDYLIGISPSKGKLEIGIAERTDYTHNMADAFRKSSPFSEPDKKKLDELKESIEVKQGFMKELEERRKGNWKGYKDLDQKKDIETMQTVLGGVSKVLQAEKAGKAEKDELKNAIAKANEELTKFRRHFAGKFDRELSGHAEITADDIKKGQARAAQKEGQSVTLASGQTLHGVTMPVFNEKGNPFFEADKNARQSLCLIDEEGNAQGCMTTLARDGKFRIKQGDNDKVVSKAEVKLASGDKVRYEFTGKTDGRLTYKITAESSKEPTETSGGSESRKPEQRISRNTDEALEEHFSRFGTDALACASRHKGAEWKLLDLIGADNKKVQKGLCLVKRNEYEWAEPAINEKTRTRSVFIITDQTIVRTLVEFEPAK